MRKAYCVPRFSSEIVGLLHLLTNETHDSAANGHWSIVNGWINKIFMAYFQTSVCEQQPPDLLNVALTLANISCLVQSRHIVFVAYYCRRLKYLGTGQAQRVCFLTLQAVFDTSALATVGFYCFEIMLCNIDDAGGKRNIRR